MHNMKNVMLYIIILLIWNVNTAGETDDLTGGESENEIIRCALEIAENIEDQDKKNEIQLKAAVAYYQAEKKEQGMRLLSEVLESSLKIEDFYDRENELENIAKAYSEIGKFFIALEIAKTLKHRPNNSFSPRSNTLIGIAFHIPPEDLNMLRDIVKLMHNDFYKVYVYYTIARREKENGNDGRASLAMTKALESARRTDGPFQIEALTWVALAYHEMGQDDEALQILSGAYKEATKDPHYKHLIKTSIPKIAVMYSQIGRFKKALEFLQMVKEPYEKVRVMGKIAEQYEKAGQKKNAVSLLEEALSISGTLKSHKGKARKFIVLKYLSCNELAKALEIAETIEKSCYRTGSRVHIAAEFAKRGNKEKSLALLSKALKEAVHEIYYIDRQELLADIAADYMEAGQIERALTIVRNIEDSYRKAYALVEIAALQMKTGKNLDEQCRKLLEDNVRARPRVRIQCKVDTLSPVLKEGPYIDTWCYEPCDCVRITWPMELIPFSEKISRPHIRLREGASRLLSPRDGECDFIFVSDGEFKARVFIRCLYSDECSNSIFVRLNSGPAVIAGNRKEFSRWSWAGSLKTMTVRKGINRLTLRGREDGFIFDRVIITGFPVRKSTSGLERQLNSILRTQPPEFERISLDSGELPRIGALSAHAFTPDSIVIGKGRKNSISVLLRLNSSRAKHGTIKLYSLRAGLYGKKQYSITPEQRTKLITWTLNFRAVNPMYIIPIYIDVFDDDRLICRERVEFINPLNWGFWGPYPGPEGKGLNSLEGLENDMTPFHNLSPVGGIACRQVADGSCYTDLGVVDFTKVFHRKNLYKGNSIAYTVTCLPSGVNPHAGIMYGGDDRIKVWLNGRELLRVDADLPLEHSRQMVGTPLRKGRNFFVFKVPQSKGPWQLMFEPDRSGPGDNSGLMHVLPIKEWHDENI